MIHQTAIIDPSAKIADDVEIGPYSIIGANVKIDSGTWIGPHVVINGPTKIGKDNRIFQFASIGEEPQDLKYNGEEVELIIGDNNTIREFTLFNPGTAGGGSKTIIGSHNLFMGYVHVGHDSIIGSHCIFANAATIAGHVEIGDHVVVGGMTPIHQFVHIGDYAMVAGASALSQDVPPFCMAEGNRAGLRGLNLTGLRRKVEREDINELKSAYRELFEKGRPLKEAAQEILDQTDNRFAKELANFVIKTKRGIAFERKANDS